ncbi:hypothetical protein OAD33_08390 [Alphaproteobacteria bacterium]|nr:hypothetical protein [Alphaproteobacteria bacterium]
MKSNTNLIDPITYMILAGGRICAFRCQALSKRTKLQCGAPALKGKSVCRFHGGKSTGPITIDGKQRCAKAKTVHGWETREKRRIRAEKFKEMDVLVSSLKSD